MTTDKRHQRNVGVALAIGYSALTIAAAGQVLWLSVAAAIGVVIAEHVARRGCLALVRFLGVAGVCTATRALWRDAAVAIAAISAIGWSTRTVVTLTAAISASHVLARAKAAAAMFVVRRHQLPIDVRNIDLPGLRLPKAAPAWAIGYGRDQVLNLNVGLIPATVVAVAIGSAVPLIIAAGASTVVGLVVLVAVVPGAVRALRMPTQSAVLAAVTRGLAELAPTVVVHQAGDPDSLYQLRMWLRPVAASGQPAVVIVRNRATFLALSHVDLPVLCVPSGVTLISLPLPTVKVALYPANAGPNIHLLREPGMRHVFIGHGDSDKAASVNPFSKVYDEVWVAGPAGRQRYRRAMVGVRDEDIVEIGRPQLDGVNAGEWPRQADRLTVLYAPTWEGWGDDSYHTSLITMGERIIQTLLTSPVPVRVIYRPHPLTGNQSSSAARAHRRVVAMVAGTPASRPTVSTLVGRPLDALRFALAPRRPGEVPDESDVVLDTPLALSAVGGPSGEANHTYDTAGALVGPAPSLHDCFNEADVLITDVSSVIADWIASLKPYLVANPADLGTEEFRRRNPSASAAYLLSRDCAELASVVARVAHGDDPLAPARRDMRHDLLGPHSAPQQRFANQLDRLVAAGRGRGWRAVTQPAGARIDVESTPLLTAHEEGAR